MPDANSGSTSGLHRSLGLFSSTMLVASMMIGTGVYKKIVPMAQTGLTEGMILFAWLAAGIVSYMGATIVAQLSTLSDKSGGIYEYFHICFGRFVAFVFGWTEFSLMSGPALAAMAFVVAHAVHMLIPIPNPFASLEHWHLGIIYPFADGGIKIVAIATLVILAIINIRGVRQAGNFNNFLTLCKIAGMLLIIAGGLFFAGGQASEKLAENSGEAMEKGTVLSAFLAAMLSALWAYDGWTNLTYVTGEIKNPKRNVPLAIMIGIGLVMGLYLLVNYAYIHTMGLAGLAAVGANEVGAAVVTRHLFGDFGMTLVVALLLVSSLGALHGVLMAHSRVSFRMAQQGQFFAPAAKVHPRFKTPANAIIYRTAWGSILVMSGTFDMLSDMVIFSGFLFYSLLIAALVKARNKGMITKKLFGYPYIPAFMLLFSVALVANTFYIKPYQSLLGRCLILAGIPVFFMLKKKA